MKITKLLIAGIFALATFGASAATISVGSSIGFGGPEALTGDAANGGNVVIGNLGDGQAVVTALSGDFVTAGITPFLTSATFATPITWGAGGALTSPTSGSLIWSLNGVVPASFTLTSGTAMDTIGGNLEIMALGTLALDGYDATDGIFTFTSSGISFSVETSAVPIPAAAWLFGSGLIGLAGIARRKKATA